MRSFIIIVVLSALVACYGASVLPSEDEMTGEYTLVYDDMSPEGRIMSKAELNARSDDWILVSEGIVNAPAAPGQVQRIGTWYQADAGVRIERLALSYSAFPADVYHSPLGTNYLEVRITSVPSQRIYSNISAFRRAR